MELDLGLESESLNDEDDDSTNLINFKNKSNEKLDKDLNSDMKISESQKLT